jgi:hypothetical protein
MNSREFFFIVDITFETIAASQLSISLKAPWSIQIASASFRYRLMLLGFYFRICIWNKKRKKI